YPLHDERIEFKTSEESVDLVEYFEILPLKREPRRAVPVYERGRRGLQVPTTTGESNQGGLWAL
ncbi:unnamed protein product, partial [Ceratitis capitata]